MNLIFESRVAGVMAAGMRIQLYFRRIEPAERDHDKFPAKGDIRRTQSAGDGIRGIGSIDEIRDALDRRFTPCPRNDSRAIGGPGFAITADRECVPTRGDDRSQTSQKITLRKHGRGPVASESVEGVLVQQSNRAIVRKSGAMDRVGINPVETFVDL